MYGPLVLAGINVTTDIWVPEGGTAVAKADPDKFIRRVSNSSLKFEATGADGDKISLIPLFEVMAEKYVVYFMTAGTKPPQPHNGYCPHSKRDLDAGENFATPAADNDEDLVALPPGPPPSSQHPTVHSLSKGASWRVVDGQLVGHTYA